VGLKVAMIAPWKVRCGIFTYTEKLSHALAQQDVDVYIVRLPRFGFKSPQIVRDVAERVPYKEVDLVHVQHEYGLYQNFDKTFFLTLKAAGKPIVTTMHAVGKWDVDPGIAAVSSKVIVHNQFCRRRFHFPNTVIIPHGAELIDVPDVKVAKKTLGIATGVPVVGYLGFISSYKGLETLIKAMVKVEKAGLLIAGGWHVEAETEYIDSLRQFSNVLGERVKWLGYVPDEQMKITYAAMDIGVYPSRFATESGALITALSHGKAVIASRLSPFVEKEKEGALITFKDVVDLRRKIRRLLRKPELRHQLEEGAKQYVKNTSWRNIALQHIALYKSLLGSPRHNSGDSAEVLKA